MLKAEVSKEEVYGVNIPGSASTDSPGIAIYKEG